MIPWLLAGLAGVLIAVHMVRPRFERRHLSSARFFQILPPPKKGTSRLRWGAPPVSVPFLLRLTLLLLCLAAILFPEWKRPDASALGFGVWVLVDTSASMSTRQNGTARMTAVEPALRRLLARAEASAGDARLVLRVSAFDLERRDLVWDGEPASAAAAIANLAPRPLGTDLGLVRRLIANLRGEDTADRTVTHVVVLSDLPAPDWASGEAPVVIWRDLGLPVDNAGFTGIQANRHPLTGKVNAVEAELTAYGAPPPRARLRISGPGGAVIHDVPVQWDSLQGFHFRFQPPAPGLYTLSLPPGDGYTFDDEATIRVSAGQAIRVDWRHRDRAWFNRLGWQQDGVRPDFRVAELGSGGGAGLPMLLLGPGYGRGLGASGNIGFFQEDHPLLDDLNLDAAESLNVPGFALPEGFRPVLQDQAGNTWLAKREDPPAVAIPGPPTGGDDNLGRFSATVFFNAVRLLMRERPPTPLYTLTAPGSAAVEDTRLALHPGEGDTARPNRQLGGFGDLTPVRLTAAGPPSWPWFLALAAAVFLLERGLVALGGRR